MLEERFAVLLAGVGGQGVLTAARILGDAAHAAGKQVVVGQLHGMSQRGGSVECSVLLGPGQSSFLPFADVVLGFEPLETLRARDRMRAGTKVLVNRGPIMLSEFDRQGLPYPPLDRILAEIRGVSSTVVAVDGPGAVERVGEARTLNILLLGALDGLGWLPWEEATTWRAVARRCGARYLDANQRAFALGRSLILHESSGAERADPTNRALKSR